MKHETVKMLNLAINFLALSSAEVTKRQKVIRVINVL